MVKRYAWLRVARGTSLRVVFCAVDYRAVRAVVNDDDFEG